MVERASATIATVEQLFSEHWPTSAAVYLPGGAVPAAGSMFTNVTLADTYARILREAESAGGDRERQIEKARDCWSRGFVAEAIDKFCRTQEIMDTSGERHRGVLTADDMARWQPTVEPPVTLEYGRYTVCKGGFWSQGPVMLQQLALLKSFSLDGADPASAEFIHTVVECVKLAYADRETFYGDPNFVKVPGETLLSEAYNAERRKLVGETASLEQRPGTIKGFGKQLPLRVPAGARTVAAGAGEPTVGKIWTHDDVHDPSVIMVDDAKARQRRHDARRHRAFRYHRPGRQHGVGDAVGRLAAILAHDPGARLLSRFARAAILARRRPSQCACAGKTSAHLAHADDGAA